MMPLDFDEPEPETTWSYADGPLYPDVEVQLTGRDGSAGAIIANVAGEMKAQGVPKEMIDQFRVECFQGTYDDLPRTVQRWVEVY